MHDYEDSSYVFRFNLGAPIKKYALPANKYGQVKAYIPVGHNQFLFVSTTYTALCRGDDFDNHIKVLSIENIPGNFVRGLPYETLKIENKGNVIFPGANGIYEYVPSTKTLQPYSTSVYPTINLSRQLMFALKEDERGNIWIARDGSDGLLVYNPGKLKFNFLKAPPKYFNLVYSLAVKENENVIAANFQMGLNVFDRNGKFQRHVALPRIENGLSPSIRAMNFIDRDHLVMKSLVNKLLVLNTEDYSVLDISEKFPKRAAAQLNVFDVNFFKVNENELHFTHGNYILKVTKVAEAYTVSLLDSLYQVANVTSITYSANGRRIVGTSNGCYIKEDSGWRKIPGTDGYPIKFISVDKKGTIWGASLKGILVIEQNKVSRIYNAASGLINETIYGILFDEEGNAWYSSNRGLGCIEKNGNIKFFTEADGLQGDEFDTQSFWKGLDGKLYFGGINGITSFYPNHVLQPEEPGKIILTGLQVNGESRPIEGRIEDLSEIGLPYNQNALVFDFTLSDFSDPSNNVYQIKMESLEKDWVNLKNVHSTRYLLAPGHYQFRIKGSNDGSNWSEDFIFPVVISPAWWQTVFFKSSAFILGMGLLSMGGWWYSKQKTLHLRQQLQLQLEMQKERERISRDLHDNIGAYSTAMIANTDYLERTVSDKESKEKVLYLKENARNILSTIRETIWLLNSKNLTVSGFSEGFINYCTNILRHYEGIEIEFKEEIIQNKSLSPTLAINLLRILQEAIQNTVKHSKANKINCFIKSDEQLSITITDNGSGFEASGKVFGNGLKNMQHRATEINFEFKMKSENGMGTEIVVEGRV